MVFVSSIRILPWIAVTKSFIFFHFFCLIDFYFIATLLRCFNRLQNHLKLYNFDHDFEVRWKIFLELFFSYFKIIIASTLLRTGPPYIKRKGTKRRETDYQLTFFLFMLYINETNKSKTRKLRVVVTCGNVFLQISRQYCYSVWGKICFIWNVYFQCFIIEKMTTLCFVLSLYDKNRFIFTIYFYIICLVLYSWNLCFLQ